MAIKLKDFLVYVRLMTIVVKLGAFLCSTPGYDLPIGVEYRSILHEMIDCGKDQPL